MIKKERKDITTENTEDTERSIRNRRLKPAATRSFRLSLMARRVCFRVFRAFVVDRKT